ncbi:hypothetical protein TNCV_1305471 [Trichonephila clavipes]|nr:hypothetical protein TNCV_1305471 [Trichonephila clavipes]
MRDFRGPLEKDWELSRVHGPQFKNRLATAFDKEFVLGESTIRDGRMTVWRRKNEEFEPKHLVGTRTTPPSCFSMEIKVFLCGGVIPFQDYII